MPGIDNDPHIVKCHTLPAKAQGREFQLLLLNPLQ